MIGPTLSSKESAEIVRRHQAAETATVTPIDAPHIKSAHYTFSSEDEAQMFAAGVKEDLASEPYHDYVDHEVFQDDSPTSEGWVTRIDYVDRTPPQDVVA